MAFSTLFTAHSIWSMRQELIAVSLAFLGILLMPVIAVIILTQTGINIVSDSLVGLDSESQSVVILNPADGSVVTEVNAPMVWPVRGIITLEFGQSSGFQLFHTGLDIANAQGVTGDPITPMMDGTVIYAGEIFWGYGKHIIIDHGDNITSVYGHLDRIFVYAGQQVHIGDTIGLMGSTGWSTGPHLHFETRVYDIPVNPRVFLGGG
ncbi:M23 family metallopeptidase [Candidatus Woesebacteria bacterium]|nr:M23 family metallopeptidase [Candidatus Woesebacteria bacterium]